MATRIGDKPLSDLTDEELQQELAKRRRSRGAASPVPAEAQSETLRNRQIRQYYANLELKPGASLDEVQARYRDLSRRYNPDRHLNDPEKHAAATRLLQELTRAYDALVLHLDKKK
jgi:hypothetical protein